MYCWSHKNYTERQLLEHRNWLAASKMLQMESQLPMPKISAIRRRFAFIKSQDSCALYQNACTLLHQEIMAPSKKRQIAGISHTMLKMQELLSFSFYSGFFP